jgi:uncharacterized membrane protein YdjX (TVP38/TMEM64 family)
MSTGASARPAWRLSRDALAKLALAAVALALGTLLVRRPEILALANPARVQEWLAAAGPLAPLLLIAMMTTAVVVTPIPSLPIDLAAGAYFGSLLGTLYTVTGALIGGAICFGVARYLGAGAVERFAKGHIQLCGQCSDRLLTGVVVVARLLPIVSFDLVSYAAGLTRMSARRFVVATALGMLPPTFLLNALGQSALVDPKLTVALGAVVAVLFFLLPRWIERRNPLGLQRYFRHEAAS